MLQPVPNLKIKLTFFTNLKFLMDRPAAEASLPSVASLEINYEAETLCLSRITLLVNKSSTAKIIRSLKMPFNETNASSSLSFALFLFPRSKVLLSLFLTVV